jgi:MYXO-CTERM domain-containing protein
VDAEAVMAAREQLAVLVLAAGGKAPVAGGFTAGGKASRPGAGEGGGCGSTGGGGAGAVLAVPFLLALAGWRRRARA